MVWGNAASSSCWALVAALVILPALATAELHILSPRPREMFVRLPVPVLVHISGDMAEDTDIRVLLHVDGVLVRAWHPSRHVRFRCKAMDVNHVSLRQVFDGCSK